MSAELLTVAGDALLTNNQYSVPGISAVPHDDNLRYFDVTIDGPSQSPYEGRSLFNPLKFLDRY